MTILTTLIVPAANAFFLFETSVLCKYWPLVNKVMHSFFLEIYSFIT